MLAIGRGLMTQPDLLMLDEPSLGLAPMVVDAVFEQVQAIHRGGDHRLPGGAKRAPGAGRRRAGLRPGAGPRYGTRARAENSSITGMFSAPTWAREGKDGGFVTAASSYDVAVIGLGGMGSSAAYHLARRGARVLGLEQFGPAHDQGSSHGRSRIIRQAYFEGATYVPLLRRAYELWHQLQKESGQPLLTMTGGLYLGAPGSRLIDGALSQRGRSQSGP